MKISMMTGMAAIKSTLHRDTAALFPSTEKLLGEYGILMSMSWHENNCLYYVRLKKLLPKPGIIKTMYRKSNSNHGNND